MNQSKAAARAFIKSHCVYSQVQSNSSFKHTFRQEPSNGLWMRQQVHQP